MAAIAIPYGLGRWQMLSGQGEGKDCQKRQGHLLHKWS